MEGLFKGDNFSKHPIQAAALRGLHLGVGGRCAACRSANNRDPNGVSGPIGLCFGPVRTRGLAPAIN